MLVAYLLEEMWWLHASELYITMRLEGLYIIKKQWKPYTSKNLTLGGENARMWALLGNLVHQFPGVVTLAYYLRLTRMIHHFEAKKMLFRVSK